MKENFLELTGLGKTYETPQGPAIIVKNFNLRICQGEFVCIIGHSGCGKSTILSIAMGLNEPTEGGTVLAGKEVSGPGTDRGVVFQSPSLLPWLTAGQNVLLSIGQINGHKSRTEQNRLAEKYLAMVGLNTVADSYPDELSAGMRQRVGIARAFALEPKILLLDEPFSLLDALTRMELQDELILLLEKDPKTVLMVTHDVDEALLLANRIVMMTSGPAATVGEILTVPFLQPRNRLSVLSHPDYYHLRDHLTTFLEERASQGKPLADSPDEAVPAAYSSVEDNEGKMDDTFNQKQPFLVEKYTWFNRLRSKHRVKPTSS